MRVFLVLVLVTLAAPAFAGPQIIFFQPAVVQPQFALVSTSPAANAELAAAPDAILLTFSAPILAANTSVVVRDPYGNAIATPTPDVAGSALKVKLPPLKAGSTGTYRVEWNAACACAPMAGQAQQSQQGSFYFSIR